MFPLGGIYLYTPVNTHTYTHTQFLNSNSGCVLGLNFKWRSSVWTNLGRNGDIINSQRRRQWWLEQGAHMPSFALSSLLLSICCLSLCFSEDKFHTVEYLNTGSWLWVQINLELPPEAKTSISPFLILSHSNLSLKPPPNGQFMYLPLPHY